MLIMGLHFGHDASITFLEDGAIRFFYEKERYTRVKHAAALLFSDIADACRLAGVNIADVDFVAVSTTQGYPYLFDNPSAFGIRVDLENRTGLGGSRYVATDKTALQGLNMMGKLKSLPHDLYGLFGPALEGKAEAAPLGFFAGADDFLHQVWQPGGTFEDLLARDHGHFMDGRKDHHVPVYLRYGDREIPGAVFSHHYCHASYAFYASNFADAAIVTLDLGGCREPEGGGFYFGADGRFAPIVPHYLYSAHVYTRIGIALHLGEDASAPGKLMGLAAYGRALFYDRALAGNAFDIEDPLGAFYNQAIIDAKRLGYDLNLHGRLTHDEVPVDVDMAASVQRLFEETMLNGVEVLYRLLEKAGRRSDNICLSGGGALNCPTNTRIWRESKFRNVFVPPACNDGGLSLGSAFALYHNVLDHPAGKVQHRFSDLAYAGNTYDEARIEQALAQYAGQVVAERCDDIAGAAADLLAQDKLLGWFEGRSEVGPRALGHRSILANPIPAENWPRVNVVKHRERWRPFAPMVLAQEQANWFRNAPANSPFMLFNAEVTSNRIPAITHADGTARIQTVWPETGRVHGVLQAFHARTGVPVLMNTSFNDRGEPIVETPEQALAFFVKGGLDALVLENWLVRLC